jgi:2-methylcitrate dehydratase PrpD
VSEVSTAARQIAEFATSLEYAAIPAEVTEAAKLHLLDTLGCGLAAHSLEVATHARRAMLQAGGRDDSTVIGSRDRLPAASAALANGTLCHGLDFDDTHSGSITHVSAVVGPASLAQAEAVEASGTELIVALVAGSETVARIGAAAAPAYMQRGFHPTSVCGIFGATAAAARLGGLDAAATSRALGIAGSMASGIFEYLADGSNTKPIHAGWAAHGAVLASALAEYGATGPETVLEGRFGLFAAYFGFEGSELLSQLGDLGHRWETPRIAFKPFPACHFIHSALDAALTATGDSPLTPEEIEAVVVSIPAPGVPLVLEPREAKVTPRTEYDAKFSLQYSLAAMLVHGRVGVSTYTHPAIEDPRVLALAGRISHEPREFITYPAAFPAAVRIRTADGRTLEAEVPYQRGGPENPMSVDEVRAKFRDNAALALPEEAVAALDLAVLELEQHDELRSVFSALACAEPVPADSQRGQ